MAWSFYLIIFSSLISHNFFSCFPRKSHALLNAEISINCHNQTPFLSHLVFLTHLHTLRPFFLLFKTQQQQQQLQTAKKSEFTDFSFSSSTWLFFLLARCFQVKDTFYQILFISFSLPFFPWKNAFIIFLFFCYSTSDTYSSILSISLWASFCPYRTRASPFSVCKQ